MKRRFWAGLLSFVMLWSLLPASALATEEGTPEPGKEGDCNKNSQHIKQRWNLYHYFDGAGQSG